MKVFKSVFVVLMTYALIAGIVREEVREKVIHVFSQITLLMPLQNFLVIVTVIVVYEVLTHMVPSLKWSFYSLFRKKNSESRESVQQEGNIQLLPIEVMYFGLLYLFLFAFNLPRFANMEEEMFRQGTVSWKEGMLRSICFGFAHCLVGVIFLIVTRRQVAELMKRRRKKPIPG